MKVGILDFGEGSLWFNYLIFCAVASLGVLQFAAAHARLVGLMLFAPRISRWVGVGLGAGAFIWFFAVQPDLFIPGLAGGELFALFLLGFAAALVIALGLGIVNQHVGSHSGPREPPGRENILLKDGSKAELWLPLPKGARKEPAPGAETAAPSEPLSDHIPLVVGLRESEMDGLDVLSGELVACGAAVLLCNQRGAESALEFVEAGGGRFHPTHRYVMGVGRGADRALRLAAAQSKFRAALALGPFGREANARSGLRWLRETDYLTACKVTWRAGEFSSGENPPNSLVVYGDEDMLIRPSVARGLYPTAIMVAGARHLTLAVMPATLRLAADLFQVRLPLPKAAGQGRSRATYAHEETAE